MNICYSDIEPLSQYSTLTLHLFPATRILNENPLKGTLLWGLLLNLEKHFLDRFAYEIFCTPDSC